MTTETIGKIDVERLLEYIEYSLTKEEAKKTRGGYDMGWVGGSKTYLQAIRSLIQNGEEGYTDSIGRWL